MKRPQVKTVRAARDDSGKTSPGESTSRLEQLAFPVLLSVVAALQVAAPLIPSEAVWQGGGAELTLAWWLVATATAFWLAARRQPLRWTGADIAVLVLLAWTLVSAQFMAWQGNPRTTWNTAWQATSLLAGYWAMRQLFLSPVLARAMLAVVMSVAVALAGHGVYQGVVGLPAQRAAYHEANEVEKQRMLRENGVDPAPDSPQRRLFEGRLDSTEPYATFGLANSLAGMLVPWTLLLLAIGLEPPSHLRLDLRRRVVWGLALVLLLLCLLLTKSRSAWLAVLFGISLLALEVGSRDWGVVKRWSWVVALVLLIALGLGLVSGTLDKEIVTEAGLSLRYRWEYWEGARAMLGDHPWLGCGPGNFQDYYSHYKLPQASETVADPHNLLWEVAANTGFIGGLALLGFLGLTFLRLLRPGTSNVATEWEGPGDADHELRWSVRGIQIGAVLGIVISLPLGYLVGFPPELLTGVPFPVTWLLGIPVLTGMLWVLDPWVLRGTLAPRIVAISLAGLVVNLLAAGGIGYSGVSQSLWLLAAAGLSLFSSESRVHSGRESSLTNRAVTRASRVDPWSRYVAIFATVGLTFAMYLQTYRAVTEARVMLQRAPESRNYEQLEGWYIRAAAADPLDPVPWQMLAEISQLRWLEVDQERYRDRFEQCLEEARSRNQRSASFADYAGRLHLRAYRSADIKADLARSEEAFRRALTLFPNNNMGHAQLAWVLHLAGKVAEAREVADRALELDALNPHWEQQLDQRTLPDPGPGDEITDQPAAPPSGLSAEQVMRRLRNEEIESSLEGP